MIRDYQAIGKTWFPMGQQKVIPTYGKHQGAKLLATLDYETGEIYCEEHDKYDAEVFLGFLKNFLTKYPDGKTVMILDNARIHHAKLIQPFLEDNKEKLELVFLPPYSPQLNLVEGLWGWLKKSAIYNVFFSSVEEIREAIKTFLVEISKDLSKVVERLCLRL